MGLCDNVVTQADVEQVIDNHDFDVDHHDHSFNTSIGGVFAQEGRLTEVINYAAAGRPNLVQTYWQPYIISHFRGPGDPDPPAAAAFFMAEWGEVWPVLVYTINSPGEQAWTIMRDAADVWQWHQLA